MVSHSHEPGHDHHHDHHDIGDPQLVEVADGTFAYIQPDGTWWVNNTGFMVGSESVTAVDTCSTERRTKKFLETVKRVTPHRVRTLVNTHHHGDHTNGNGLVDGAVIVAHERCREILAAEGVVHYDGVWEPVDWGDLPLGLPSITFDDHLTLWVGDRPVELRHPPTAAHTTNDIVAWLPEQSVLFTGDLVFNGGTPFVLMGSVEGALESVEFLRSYGATTLVPGHGPVCGPEVLDGLARYYRFVLDLAASAKTAGVAPLEAAREADLGEFGELSDQERLVGNLHRALFELDGNERGAPMDLAAPIMDMIAYNGGNPLRCVA